MSQNSYVEDFFLEFYSKAVDLWKMSPMDYRILTDFHDKISSGDQLTQNQGNYLLRLLSKHQSMALDHGIDLSECVNCPRWKNSFRVIDYTKRIYVEKDSEGLVWVCLKFPYSFKDTFDKEIDKSLKSSSKWDPDAKVRKIDIYECNLINLHEFVRDHGFEIEDSFITAVAQTEEIWDQQDSVIPYAVADGSTVELKNANEDTLSYWNSHRSDHYEKNLFLAKRMGFVVKFTRHNESLVGEIAASESTDFWIKDLSTFFELYQKLDGIFCILVDRNTQNIIGWLDDFVKKSDFAGISRKEIKVCFREADSKISKLNQWIKDNYVGGAVKDGKILIFQHKPPKWLFKDELDVKIIATNSFTPITEPLSSAWISGHPCVCYLGDIKPTRIKDRKIVEL